MQLPKPKSTVKRAVPPVPPLPPGYEHLRKTPVPSAPTDIPTAIQHAKAAKSRKVHVATITVPATVPKKRGPKPKPKPPKPPKLPKQKLPVDPYAHLHEVQAPYAQFPSTLTALAEIFFLLEYDQVLEFKPRTLAEHAIRSAWIKAAHGDVKALTMLWDRMHQTKQSNNALAEFLASLGQSAGLKPVTQYPEDQDDED